jgi:hypothetical protein
MIKQHEHVINSTFFIEIYIYLNRILRSAFVNCALRNQNL